VTIDTTSLLERARADERLTGVLSAVAQIDGVWLVGGAVRDLLLARGAPDVDLVVDGPVAPVLEALAGEPGATVLEHDRFGTARIDTPRGVVDIARARSETYPQPGALPLVAPANLETDLLRRDFTVNAIALAVGGARSGELAGAPDALEDLDAGRLRVLHENSFRDDPTRLLRLARYAARLGFKVEQHTDELREAALAAGALSTVSAARLGDELRMLLREPDPTAALERARTLGVLSDVAGIGLEPDANRAHDALALLPDDARADLLLLAEACRDSDAAALGVWLDALEFTAGERDRVVAAATRSAELAAALENAATPADIAAAARSLPPEAVALAGALGARDGAQRWLQELAHIDLDIDGEDLIAAGIPEGPAIGRALDRALAARLDGEAPTRDAQLEIALAEARR
jgi:tRNA nucleotidyltransferase (CCA-adding enzyme)